VISVLCVKGVIVRCGHLVVMIEEEAVEVVRAGIIIEELVDSPIDTIASITRRLQNLVLKPVIEFLTIVTKKEAKTLVVVKEDGE
jgi:hypothetical protein